MVNKWRISYERDQKLGNGAYGVVYLGKLVTEERKEIPVAVKQVWIQRDLLSSAEDRELANQLKLGQHPNVVKLLHWEDQGEDFRYLKKI